MATNYVAESGVALYDPILASEREEMSCLFETGEGSDIILDVYDNFFGQKEMRLHKEVLCRNSNYMRKLFAMCPNEEKFEIGRWINRVPMTDIFLKFLYTGVLETRDEAIGNVFAPTYYYLVMFGHGDHFEAEQMMDLAAEALKQTGPNAEEDANDVYMIAERMMEVRRCDPKGRAVAAAVMKKYATKFVNLPSSTAEEIDEENPGFLEQVAQCLEGLVEEERSRFA